jgi:hypothetical protein
MATLSTSALNWLANEWEKVYKTAVLSGIVGDLAHKKRGGYHISREDQPKTNYSVIRTDDKPGNGPSDRASAIDMTMSTSDMIKCHTRLRDAWKNRANDPRMKYINAWNGWDGQGDAGRYDVVKGTIAFATADHKWHIHLEIRRKYVNDMIAMKAILSLIKGESLDTYRGVTTKPSTPVSKPTTPAVEDDDMPLTDADVKKVVDAVWKKHLNIETDAKKPANLQEAGSILRYTSSEHHKLSTLASQILTKLNGDLVDEKAIAATLAGDLSFISGLANAISAKLPSGVQVTPEDLADALKTTLRNGVAE